MKWFKHYGNAHTNKLVQALLQQKNGHELHSMYWLLLELLCTEFKKDTVKFTFSETQLKGALMIKHTSKLEKFLRELREFSESFDENLLKIIQLPKKFYEIETPIILELMGKDFKRTRLRRGSTTSKKKEERIKKKNKSDTVECDAFEITNEMIDVIYALYPRKEGKQLGYKKFKKQITTKKKFQLIKTARENYVKKIESENIERRYILKFSNFMDNWEDYIDYEPEKIPSEDGSDVFDFVNEAE